MAANATAGAMPAGVLERGEVGSGRVLFDARALASRAARVRTIEVRFELGDEILEVVDLMRQIGGALPFGIQCLLGDGLFVLPLVDQHVHAQLLAPEQGEIAR